MIRFRTETEPIRTPYRICHDDGGVVLMGSCFSDNIGERLETDGFKVCRNPMGPLYNPKSLATALTRLIDGYTFSARDLTPDSENRWHALDFPLRYSDTDAGLLLDRINQEFLSWSAAISEARTIIITFGTAWIFNRCSDGYTVGNCHKFPSSQFERQRLSVDEIVSLWAPLVNRLKRTGKQLIFTVSPIRHTADGLHGNQLSKATLLLACEQLETEYFPSYEIMLDDLRDYRFYADDLKHPSTMAVEYIYEHFGRTYFSESTRAEAARHHAAWLHKQHRQS